MSNILLLRYHIKFICLTGLVSLVILVNACKQESIEQEVDSFQVIQNQIFEKNCATSGCHASKTDGSFKQHGLVLEKSVAFTNLINISPNNPNAKSDGMLRVKPFKADQSFLRQTKVFYFINYSKPQQTTIAIRITAVLCLWGVVP
ncbi:MAG: hypothetical protein MUE81_24105 [Thermoflexibacter sp.]|nr:hypothetical protein [Thermoflexibacter sp.]